MLFHPVELILCLAVDVSESMKATDVSPSRMDKAKQEVEKFLQIIEGDRVGLIAFAGSAYTFCPLTNDYSAIRLYLDAMDPGIISDAGTNIPSSIEEAMKVFSRSKSGAYKVLVVFSDGENHEQDPSDLVKKALEQGIRIYTIGIGHIAKAGERIPLVEGNYKTDQLGNIIITHLDEQTLKNIANDGNGSYFRVSEAGTELRKIYSILEKMEDTEFREQTHHIQEDRYQIPLSIALLLLFISYTVGNRSYKIQRRTQGMVEI